MRQDKLSKQNVILYLCGIIPVVWLGLLIAPCLKDGLPGLVQQFGSVMQNPFQIQLCEDSVKTVLTLLLVYGIAIGVYLSTEHNYRRREEHGSAKWGTAGSVNKKYANKDKTENKLLTQNVAIGLDGRKHRRNLNVLVCGGSGAGKTRFYAKPNIMNANTSFVVLDPKGELLRDTGHLLEEKGYEIKVLDLIDMEKSHCYNPFVYISSDDDIQRLTTNLFKNTTPKGSQTQDPFWDQTAAMLLKALVCYLHYEAPPDEQNFSMVMEMIRAGDVKEDNEEYQSVLDELFERLEERNPEHIALKYYRAYHSGSAKTLKSIQISLVSRLEKFNLDSLAGITQCDEMDLGQIGEKKTAVFAVIPDNDSSFNFIVGMLYTQLFQQLYYAAWRETDEGKNREIVFGKFEACSEDDSIIFMECNEKVSKELKKDCHRKQYIRSRDAETPFQVMSYSTMTFQESEIYGEDVLEDTECNVEESVMQRMDIERVRTALKMLAPEERAIIQDFFFTESPIPVKELVEKYAMPKTSIYRKRDDALKKLKKILGNT